MIIITVCKAKFFKIYYQTNPKVFDSKAIIRDLENIIYQFTDNALQVKNIWILRILVFLSKF